MTVAEARVIVERMAAIGEGDYPTVAEYLEALKILEETKNES